MFSQLFYDLTAGIVIIIICISGFITLIRGTRHNKLIKHD